MDQLQQKINQNESKSGNVSRSEIAEIKSKLDNLDAEQVVVNRITNELTDRLERKFSDRNLVTLGIVLITNISGFGIFLPQAEKNITESVEDKIEAQVETNLVQQKQDLNEDIETEIDQQLEEKIDQEVAEEISDQVEQAVESEVTETINDLSTGKLNELNSLPDPPSSFIQEP